MEKLCLLKKFDPVQESHFPFLPVVDHRQQLWSSGLSHGHFWYGFLVVGQKSKPFISMANWYCHARHIRNSNCKQLDSQSTASGWCLQVYAATQLVVNTLLHCFHWTVIFFNFATHMRKRDVVTDESKENYVGSDGGSDGAEEAWGVSPWSHW